MESKQQKLERLKAAKWLKDGLPHLYGWKWYSWARKFFESRNKINLLVAGNQLSKSSTQIRKAIHWATEPTLWPDLWPLQAGRQGFTPVFWYLYPNSDVSTIEFDEKWVPEFMPRGEFIDHEKYGWTAIKKDRKIHSIKFNSGATIYFKSYAQKVRDLQAGSVSSIFCDEELLDELYSELMFRIAATNGYFHMVFTATIGQEFWRRAMEEIGTKREALKGALKMRVSMYDCLYYEDGTPSHWTEERIEQIKGTCKSAAEIKKRIYGRFVKDTNLKYPEFGERRNTCEPFKIDNTYDIYCGVDIGSGDVAHPGAITFLAINQARDKVYAIDGWRGDKIGRTTAGDIFDQYVRMCGRQPGPVVATYYDYAAADFKTIAHRNGYPVLPASKQHEFGERLLRTAFKLGILEIFRTYQLKKLVDELKVLDNDTPKNRARDDFTDSIRYAFAGIPVMWGMIFNKVREVKLGNVDDSKKKGDREFEDLGSRETLINFENVYDEIMEANSAYGVDGF